MSPEGPPIEPGGARSLRVAGAVLAATALLLGCASRPTLLPRERSSDDGVLSFVEHGGVPRVSERTLEVQPLGLLQNVGGG
jgi:hypothetical protein